MLAFFPPATFPTFKNLFLSEWIQPLASPHICMSYQIRTVAVESHYLQLTSINRPHDPQPEPLMYPQSKQESISATTQEHVGGYRLSRGLWEGTGVWGHVGGYRYPGACGRVWVSGGMWEGTGIQGYVRRYRCLGACGRVPVSGGMWEGTGYPGVCGRVQVSGGTWEGYRCPGGQDLEFP